MSVKKTSKMGTVMNFSPMETKATKETKRLTHATVHPCRASSCRDNQQQAVAPRRQGPRVPSPSHTGVFGPPPFCALMTPTLFREFSFFWQFGRFLFGMPARSYESAPFFAWSVLGSPPSCTFHHCTGQVATDPQSLEGGSQRACPTRGAHPTASGRVTTVAFFKQSYPALAVNKRSLWDASPGDLSQPHCSKIGFWVVALYSLTQHGCLHRLREQGQCLSAQAGTFLIELMRQDMDHTVSVDCHAFQACEPAKSISESECLVNATAYQRD